MGSDDGDRETGGCQIDGEENVSDFSQQLCEPISREEVLWALNAMIKDAASRVLWCSDGHDANRKAV